MASLIARGAIPKQKAIRSRAVTNSARGRSCTLRIPGVCRDESETVVFAHLPSITHGLAYKSDDFWGVYGCARCHAVLDGQTPYKWTEAERLKVMFSALHMTQSQLINEGLMSVKNARCA